jgi:SAM-dependent methyltransferase
MAKHPLSASLAVLAAASLMLGACGRGGNQSADAGNNSAQGSLAVGYVSTEFDIVRAMLDLAGVTANDTVVDLGSGDGRIPILAAKEKGARGVGVELDRQRIRESVANAAREGVTGRVEFHQQDLFVAPLNDASVVTLFLLPEINLQLRPKILAQMRPGSRVVSNSFDMGDWRPDQQRAVEDTKIFLWIVPAKVEGRWQVQLQGGSGGEVSIDQKYQDFSGAVRSAGGGAITEGRLQGDRISFTADLGQGRRRYEGRVEGNRIVGTGWQAVRAG